jgi:uncharacterized protein
MRRLLGSWTFILFMLVVDFYVFQSLKLVSASLSPRAKLIVYAAYWSITVVAVLFFLVLPYLDYHSLPPLIRTYIFATIIGLFIAKLVAAMFFLMDDLRRLLQWGGGLALSAFSSQYTPTGEGISRSLFLSWLGMGVGGSLFGSLLFGFGNKYRYRVERKKLKFDHLPDPFKGLKIVQISDIHAGSLEDPQAVAKGVEKIMSLEPDLVFFTGDLVNNTADEMDALVDVFSKITAPMGVYSVLGNHDYGDYFRWDSKEAKMENLERLKRVHRDMGWRLLLNEHVTLERNGQSIALIGVENWGAKANFSRYGDLSKAYTGAASHPFKILLSHDPSHWEAEVCSAFPSIDLMFSGHTHGMQFGVEIPGFKWSPVQYVYKQWAGLYKKEKQHLYVNRGFGFLGYPGRVGILPEITFVELV